MKLLLFNTTEGLKPMYDDDYDNKKKLKIGQVYEASIKLKRNIDFHRKYFKLIDIAWKYLTEPQQDFYHSKEVFRKSLEISSGHCEKIYSHKLKSFVDIPKSIAFDKIDNAEFSEIYDSVKYVINNIVLRHISEDEFNKQLVNF